MAESCRLSPWGTREPTITNERAPDTNPQTKQWPEDLMLDDAPKLIEELRAAGKWIEQETIVLDPRLIDVLQACCRGIQTDRRMRGQ